MLIELAVLLVVGGLSLAIFWYREQLLDQRALANARQLVVLKVLVPKEGDQQSDAASEERKAQDFREALSIAEQFLASFSSLHESGVSRWFYGQETISLEFVVRGGKLTFFIAVPKRLQELVERQLHSYYPYAQVEESEDFRIFGESVYPAGMYVQTKRQFALPIRTYKDLESDPINSLTNSFSKLPTGMNAGFQVLIQPTDGGWRQKTVSTAKLIADGKSVEKQHWFLRGLTGLFSALRGQSTKENEQVRLTPIQEEMMKGIQEKGSHVGFLTQIRVIAVSPRSAEESRVAVENIASAFAQYTDPELNSMKRVKPRDLRQFVGDFILRRFRGTSKMILNTEELASLYHLPNQFTETTIVEWLGARTIAPPANLPEASDDTIELGKSLFRGEERMVRMQTNDRRRHVYAVGKTGVGKTTIFQYMFEQDIKAGRGCAYLDPNGDAIEAILGMIPKERAEDVILFDPGDTERPMGLNVLEWKRPEDRDFLVAEWLEIFYKLFDPNRTGMVGPQFEHWGRNASLSVMMRPEGGTLLDIPRLFTDEAFMQDTIRHVTDPTVLAFWNQQMAKTADFHKSEMLNYFNSKFGRFMTNDLVRNIIGQTKSAFDFRDVIDSGKILLVNLSKGKIGETNSYLLGMIIVAKLQVAAFQRADTPEEERKDFFLYVDEFQNFTTDTFKTILSEARKYRLALNITNQYIKQLPDDIRDAVIGNAGTLVSFRIGAEDAEFLAKEFPHVSQRD
ncbi:MAG: ATP-binding protein, partial [Patescibacteria group bacterium]